MVYGCLTKSRLWPSAERSPEPEIGMLNRRALGAYSNVLGSRVWLLRGQTTTEYVLVLVAAAILVLLAYEVLGQQISSTVAAVNTTVLSVTGH